MISFSFLRNLFVKETSTKPKSSLRQNRREALQTELERDSKTTNIGYDLSEPDQTVAAHPLKNIHGHNYVAGFMDFDPKYAARSAYRITSNRGSLKRGESSWFSM
eukprot:CAMPEP_0170080376 /NCGR_PEP_ID=MMETSP0019_2-20121128/16542_1 /TAXON_ID=98059 /ORGANISM="Dinobryon sp., Strain UTEXLB2267" /LENGTH=104 /DNA_ID=CAMNT_0010294341 /DNA_START=262 /DNA_END=576 /DNA_ORIENTATION=+